MKSGVIYIAIGERYRQRVVASVKSLKAHMPKVSVTIFTDTPIDQPLFDEVILVTTPHYNDFTDKVIYIPQSPYEHTLFIDADTYVCDDLSELFSLLETFDLAVAHDTFRIYVEDYDKLSDQLHSIPVSFPMLNTGVILFRKSKQIEQFFLNWLRIHQQNLALAPRGGTDQPAFRDALYHSDLHFTILPTEYNCRFVHPVFLNHPVKILHGPYHNFPALAAEINRIEGNRVFIPGIGTVPEKSSPILISRWTMQEFIYRTKRRLVRARVRRFG